MTRVPEAGLADPQKIIPKMRVVAAWFYFWCIVVPVGTFARFVFVEAGSDVSIATHIVAVGFGYLLTMTALPLVTFIIAGKTWPILARLLGVDVKR